MKKSVGVYETSYGNAACYFGGNYAWDMDMGEKVAYSELGPFMRPLEETDYIYEENLFDEEDDEGEEMGYDGYDEVDYEDDEEEEENKDV